MGIFSRGGKKSDPPTKEKSKEQATKASIKGEKNVKVTRMTPEEEAEMIRKRRFKRYPAADSLWYAVARPEEQGTLKEVAITRAMALGGLGMNTFQPLDQGQKVKIEIITEEDRRLQVIAEVVYCNAQEDGTYDVGVKFLRLSAEDMVYLKQKYPPKPDE